MDAFGDFFPAAGALVDAFGDFLPVQGRRNAGQGTGDTTIFRYSFPPRTARPMPASQTLRPSTAPGPPGALESSWSGAAAEIEDDDIEQYTVVRVADEVMVDLMGKACDVTYDDAIGKAKVVVLGGARIPVASKETLIRTKGAFAGQRRRTPIRQRLQPEVQRRGVEVAVASPPRCC